MRCRSSVREKWQDPSFAASGDQGKVARESRHWQARGPHLTVFSSSPGRWARSRAIWARSNTARLRHSPCSFRLRPTGRRPLTRSLRCWGQAGGWPSEVLLSPQLGGCCLGVPIPGLSIPHGRPHTWAKRCSKTCKSRMALVKSLRSPKR